MVILCPWSLTFWTRLLRITTVIKFQVIPTFLLYFVAVPQTVHLAYGQTENLPRFGPTVMGNRAHWKFPESRCCVCQIRLRYVKRFIVQCETAENLPPEGVEKGQSIRCKCFPIVAYRAKFGDCVKQWAERPLKNNVSVSQYTDWMNNCTRQTLRKIYKHLT